MSARASKRVSPRRSDEVRILFSCAGRRVELMQAFRAAARRIGVSLTVVATDVSSLAPAMHMADRAHIVPPLSSRTYPSALRDVVQRERVDLLVPLIDPDLPRVARMRDELAALGCRALISSSSVIRVCREKLRTFDFLRRHEIDTPETWPLDAILAQNRHRFPYYLKPNAGSAGRGGYKVTDLSTLRFVGQSVSKPIVQEFITGPEMTLDVYAGFDGVPRCVVPRQRLEVRGGEVSKSRIVKNPAVIEIGRRVVDALGECVGLITIQCIVDARRRVRVIEINPRFGGGVPLAIQAGADFPRWLMLEYLGRNPRIRPDAFQDGLQMLRYDQSVFVPSGD